MQICNVYFYKDTLILKIRIFIKSENTIRLPKAPLLPSITNITFHNQF